MPKKILLFNDSVEIFQMIEGVLNHEGYDVSSEVLGIVDAERVKTIRPDLVIIDCFVNQEINSWTTIARLRSIAQTALVPVILCIQLTKAINNIRSPLTSMKITLLPKPFTINDLLLTMRRVLKLSVDVQGSQIEI